MFYWSDILLDRINTTRQWQFMQLNGPNGLCFGYRDSLDLMSVNAFDKLYE